MDRKHIVHTPEAPASIGPYTQAICVGGFIYTSGQLGIDPDTMDLVDGVRAQADRALLNLTAILKAANSGLDKVMKTTVYVANCQDFGAVNEIYAKHFGQHLPARSMVHVASLPKGGLVEIDAVAYV